MNENAVSWASLVYVASLVGAAAYVLGAVSAALVSGLLRALRKSKED